MLRSNRLCPGKGGSREITYRNTEITHVRDDGWVKRDWGLDGLDVEHERKKGVLV